MRQALREAAGKVKRAPTAFNLFVKEKIGELRKAEPGLKQKEYMTKAAEAWNEYKEANGMPATKVKPIRLEKPKAEKPNVEKPKRAPTAFNLFVKDNIGEMRTAEPGLTHKDYMAKVAAAWNEHKAANGLPATKPRAPNAPKNAEDKPKHMRTPTVHSTFIKEKMAELRAAEPGLLAKEYMKRARAAYREFKAI